MAGNAVIKGHSIHRTVRVEAPLDTVWIAISSLEGIRSWFSDTITETPVEVGATGIFGWDGFGDFPFEITAIEPSSAFEYRWSGEPAEILDPADSTIVRFTLEAEGDATLVTVVESGFEKLEGGTAYRRHRLEQNRDGWNIELDELTAALES